MRTNGMDSLPPQRVRTTPSIALACLLPVLLLSSSCGADVSDPVVARHMDAFFEAFVGRDLSRDELRQVTDEFVAFHALNGKDRAGIREAARIFEDHAKTLRDGAGSPAALSMRHFRVSINYFNPDLHNTLLLRLLTAPDPVLVVDVRSRRLMTERDVVALANIRHFARSQGAPRHKALTRQQIEELVSLLKATVGGNSGNMPQFFGEAAAFWAGVQQEWPHLNTEQQQLARAYADRMWRIQIPVEMYGRLWGLDPKAALSRYSDDVSARISSITHLNMLLGNLPFVMDSIFGR
jgi:hypothetical protein